MASSVPAAKLPPTVEKALVPYLKNKTLTLDTNNSRDSTWKEDFLGALPLPKQGQLVCKWADNIVKCLQMKGYNYPYPDTVSRRVFPYLVKLFRPHNYASIPSRNLTEFIDYLRNFDRPKHRTVNLFGKVKPLKDKPSVAYNENVAVLAGDYPDLDPQTISFLAWSCMASGLPPVVRLSDVGRKIGKTF